MPKMERRRKETARTHRLRGKSKRAAVGWSRAAARLLDRSWARRGNRVLMSLWPGLSWSGTVVAVMELAGGGSSGNALLERGRGSGTGEVSRERNARGREGTGRGGASALFGVS